MPLAIDKLEQLEVLLANTIWGLRDYGDAKVETTPDCGDSVREEMAPKCRKALCKACAEHNSTRVGSDSSWDEAAF